MYMNTWVKDILFSAIVAALFLLIKGFIWNTADQIEPLVLVYQQLDSSLYEGDFYVTAAKDVFTVRYYYVSLLTFLGQYFSIQYISLFFCYLSILFSSLGLILIARKLTHNQIKAYTIPFFVLFLFLSWTVGGNELQYNLFIGSSLAKVFTILGIYFLLDRKIWLSAILIGIGAWFQVLVGLQMGILILGCLILFRQFNSMFKWGVAWGISISPILVPILYRQFIAEHGAEINMEQFYTLLYSFRNPHHYLPHLFSIGSYIKLLILFVVGTVFTFLFLDRKYFYKILVFNCLILFGLIFYSILIEFLNVPAIGKIQWFKTTIWLSAFSAMGIGIGTEYLLQRWKAYQYVGVVSCLLIVAYGWYIHPNEPVLKMDRRSAEAIELEKVHQWISEELPENALFATYIDDEGFLCTAQRPITVGWNAVIHEPWFMLSWYEKLHEQYGVDTSLHDHVKIKEVANDYYESGLWLENTNAEYCIVKKDVELKNTSIIYYTEHYKVLKIKG